MCLKVRVGKLEIYSPFLFLTVCDLLRFKMFPDFRIILYIYLLAVAFSMYIQILSFTQIKKWAITCAISFSNTVIYSLNP